MKPIIILALSILSLLQTTTAQVGNVTYDTCIYLHRFEGEYKYVNGNDTVKIFLKYFRDYIEDYNVVTDRLYGWIDYKHGSTPIYSNYADRLKPLTYLYNTKGANLGVFRLTLLRCEPTCQVLTGKMFEPNSGIKDMITLEPKLISNGSILEWWQFRQYGGGNMILPNRFTLIKQEKASSNK